MAVHRTAPDLDERSLFAEYPFLPEADKLLAGETVSVRALLEDPAYEGARALGRARILAAADDPRGSRDLDELARAAPDVRFLSFLFGRMLLSSVPAGAALRRWAVAEAKRSYGRLETAPGEELAEVARRLGYSFEPDGERVAIPLVDYVRLSVPIREGEFRLAAQSVRNGSVIVRPVRAARLLQEAVRIQLALPVPLADDVVDLIGTRERELLEDVARRTPAPRARIGGPTGPIQPALFPPCIRKMMRTLQQGENLSHAGRFALAAFLHRVGADFDTIVDAYRGAPDFDESITRYQVEHITLRDGGAGYEPPECDTLRSHGLCLRDGDPTARDLVDRERDARCFDPKLKHPLQYYRWRGGTVLDRADRAGSGPSPSGPREGRDRPSTPGRSPSTARRR